MRRCNQRRGGPGLIERDFDTRTAAAEARLDRLDDGELDPADDARDSTADTGVLDLSEPSRDGLHIEEEEPAPYAVGDDDPDDQHDTADADVMIEAFNEAFNARDLEGLVELLADDCETPGLGNDCDNFPDAVEALWEHRPTCALTRGDLEGRHVSVLWDLGDGDTWWRVAPILFDDLDGSIGVVELVEDEFALAAIEAEAPDLDLEEGARWSEWSEGEAG